MGHFDRNQQFQTTFAIIWSYIYVSDSTSQSVDVPSLGYIMYNLMKTGLLKPKRMRSDNQTEKHPELETNTLSFKKSHMWQRHEESDKKK